MKIEDIKTGDIVKLMSGGPRMTVCRPMHNGMVGCQWFDDTGKLQSATFDSETLKPA